MKIKIIDKYIFSQVFWATIVCILLFSIIWIAPEILLRTVQRVLDGTYTLEMGISVILCEIPKILANALPVGVFLGTLFVFDKLSKDSEVVILRACGASFYRIIASVLVFGAFISCVSFFVYDRLIPYSSAKYDIYKNHSPRVHFVFPVKNHEEKMEKVIIVPSFYKEMIQDVVVLNFSDLADEKGKSVLKNIYMSDYVKYNPHKLTWIINEAKSYDLTPEGVYSKVDTKKDIEILSGERAKNAFELMKFSIKRDRDLTNKELKKYIKLLKSERMDDEYRFMLNKYLQRFSHSIISIFFVIFGALLGFSKPRDQRLVGFTLAVLTVFLYYITMPFLDLMAEKDIIHPVITAFLAPFVMIFVIRYLRKKKDL